MFRHPFILKFCLLLAFGGLGLGVGTTPAAPGKEKTPSPQTPSVAEGVIRSESNVVLVDVIVTDKRGHYFKDLNQKDFHVFEDGKEQPVTSLSHQADIQRSSPEHQQYMVLFFDNMTMEPQVQMLERDAAAKFVEAKASPNHMMAVMDYGGGLRLDQDFTSNRELLKNVVSKIKFGSFEINPDAATLSGLGAYAAQQEADFALRGLLGTLRDVAKMLGKAPGRKTMIFFSAGFDFPPAAFASRQSDFQDAIDALNKANVYPVDSAGLAVPVGRGAPGATLNQILYTLAAETGGFPIVNTNDLLGGWKRSPTKWINTTFSVTSRPTRLTTGAITGSTSRWMARA